MTEPLLSTTELEQLQWRVLERRRLSRHAVAAPFAGQQTSVFRGHGMELEEVRAYQPGDDVRRMDWRATARTGRPVVKVFREERSRGLFLLVDRGPAMRFGTRGELKAARAARVAAILAFSALAGRDSVAGIVAGGGEEFFPPARNLEGTLALLRAACAPLPEEYKPLPIERLIEQSRRAAERGASICLISDFARLHEHHVPPLIRLATRHNVLAVRIVDPGEEELPNAGKLRIISPATGRICVIDTSDATLRARYAKAMAERSAALENLFRRAGIALHQIHTHRDVLQEMENLDLPT
ncbi:MAG: DUF58 domain-containing protein [Gammaproteobacteria bacterium]|nr:DUF58 domain-containing protein [Gammaproteobacteria bacterium]